MTALRYILAAIVGATLAALVMSQSPELASLVANSLAIVRVHLLGPRPEAEHHDAIVKVKDWNDGGFNHALPPSVSIRVNNFDKYDFYQRVTVTLRVGPDGKVLSARYASGPKELAKEAERVAMAFNFMPFQRNGVPVSVEFEAPIPVYPKEVRPDYKVAFPEIRDWSTLRIRLKRTACFGSCPDYEVEITGDGNVTYKGESSVALRGTHRAIVPRADVERLVQLFRKAEFFWLNKSYEANMTDNPSNYVIIEFDGRSKEVWDYVGQQAGMPDAVVDVEDEIDRVAKSDRWVTGTAETAPSLIAEKWDFKSSAPENTQMVMGLARTGTPDSVREVIKLGAPANTKATPDFGMFPTGPMTALEVASFRGSDEIVSILLETGVRWDRETVGQSLFNAASHGRTEMMSNLGYIGGADRNFRNKDGQTVLMMAAGSGVRTATELLLQDRWKGPKPDVNQRDGKGRSALFYVGDVSSPDSENVTEIDRAGVVEVLVSAGAKVNVRDDEGNTPLIESFYADTAVALIKAGANVNAQNEAGESALMEAYSETALVLLKAGADPTLKNARGETAIEVAKREGRKDVAALIKDWINKHPPVSKSDAASAGSSNKKGAGQMSSPSISP